MKKTTPSNTLLLALSAIFIFAVLKKPDIAIGYMRNGLDLCAQRVIPSLFPFAVLSALFVDVGGADLLGRFVGRYVSMLFGVSREAAFAVMAGMLCGFPVGAITAVKLYKKGSIGEKELQRLLMISSIPGSAFLVSAVGISVWSSRPFGTALYLIQILSATLIGIVLRFASPLEIQDRAPTKNRSHGDGISLFCDSVGDCAYSMLRICGFVLFFTSAVGTLCAVLEDMGLPADFKIPILGFFEMTGALSLTPELGRHGAVWAAFFVGWSGLSVHFQIMSVCRGISVSYRPYFAAKAVQGVLSALLAYLYIRFAKLGIPMPSSPVYSAASGQTVLLFAGLFALALLLPALRKKFL